MSRRAATPINVPSNAPKRARISMSIAGSSSTVVPVSAAAAPAAEGKDTMQGDSGPARKSHNIDKKLPLTD
ncbi:hypothetical protein G6F25_014222 [Rhizopus arrhizus]|nr:hypothetical protein G6F25_014222 [Rhizopus arrhizus]